MPGAPKSLRSSPPHASQVVSGVVAERLEHLELLATGLAPVVVGGHRSPPLALEQAECQVAADPPEPHTRPYRRVARWSWRGCSWCPPTCWGRSPPPSSWAAARAATPPRRAPATRARPTPSARWGAGPAPSCSLGDVAKGALAAGGRAGHRAPGGRGGVRARRRARPRVPRHPAVPRRQGRGHRRRHGAGAAARCDARARRWCGRWP